MPTIHKIIPCLWFDSQAEEAARFDPAKAGRVMKVLLGMKKLDIATLKQAYMG